MEELEVPDWIIRDPTRKRLILVGAVGGNCLPVNGPNMRRLRVFSHMGLPIVGKGFHDDTDCVCRAHKLNQRDFRPMIRKAQDAPPAGALLPPSI
jgi:hypothetical protein